MQEKAGQFQTRPDVYSVTAAVSAVVAPLAGTLRVSSGERVLLLATGAETDPPPSYEVTGRHIVAGLGCEGPGVR